MLQLRRSEAASIAAATGLSVGPLIVQLVQLVQVAKPPFPVADIYLSVPERGSCGGVSGAPTNTSATIVCGITENVYSLNLQICDAETWNFLGHDTFLPTSLESM